MIISLRISDADACLFKTYARSKNLSVSQLIRETVSERIEKDYLMLREEREKEVMNKNNTTVVSQDFKEYISK